MLGFAFIGCNPRLNDVFLTPIDVNKDSIFIKDNVNLKGKEITLQNKIIFFNNGAQLTNGHIVGHNIQIIASPDKIFQNISISGDWATKNARIEWFAGENLDDPYQNYLALTNWVLVNGEVFINKMIPMATSSNRDFFNGGKNIVISGAQKESSGLILMTQHENQFYSYFRSDHGYNLDLKNITIATDDYNKGVISSNNPEYFFAGCYYQKQLNPRAKPSIQKIKIDNCIFKGNMAISIYGAHSDNQSIQEFYKNSKIEKIKITNSEFHNVNAPLGFVNMGYDSIIIQKNKVYDFAGAFITVAESGMEASYYKSNRQNKKYVEITNNLFENFRVFSTPKERMLTPCVIKGGYGTMNFENNTLKNLISNNPDSDVFTMYYTCSSPGKCTFANNNILNVIGRGSQSHPACILKDRGASNLLIENNQITLEKEALVKNGVLKNINEPLTNLDGSRFLCALIQIGNQSDFSKHLIIKNNNISIPYLNMATEIYDVSAFTFHKNRITIEAFCPSNTPMSVSKDDVFFLGRQRLDRLNDTKPNDFECRDNQINISNIPNKKFQYIYFPDGVQVGTIDHPDKNPNFKHVIIQDGFTIQNTSLGLTMLDGEFHQYDLTINGKNNNFIVYDHNGANHLRPNAKSFKEKIRIADYSGSDSGSPFALIADSYQQLIVDNHDGSDINLLSYSYITSLYNLSKEENLICNFQINWKDKKGKSGKSHFYLHLNNQSRLFSLEDENGKFVKLDPSSPQPKSQKINAEVVSTNRISENPRPELMTGNHHLKNAELKLTNCHNIASFSIDFSVIKAGKEPINAVEAKKIISNSKIGTR